MIASINLKYNNLIKIDSPGSSDKPDSITKKCPPVLRQEDVF
jgi:hypothetical protein